MKKNHEKLLLSVLEVYANSKNYDGEQRLGFGGQQNVMKGMGEDGPCSDRCWWKQVTTYKYAKVALQILKGEEINPYDLAEIKVNEDKVGRPDPRMAELFAEYM